MIYIFVILFALPMSYICEYTISEATNCNIFCNGEILYYMQMKQITNYSKQFVDLKLLHPPGKIKTSFQDLLHNSDHNPSKKILRKFLSDNFDVHDSGLETWIPEDWKENPDVVIDIYDFDIRQWASQVNALWKFLGRKLKHDVLANNSLYSLLYVPYPFIVPGDRFNEFYYWDSYWIIDGLLLCEMHDTAKNMIQNYLYLVDLLGYIPNGGRKYYLNRSQPPFLIPMVHLYWQFTNDLDFVESSIKALEMEFNFWINNRSINVTVDKTLYTLFQYKVISANPRPESYYHDVMIAKEMDNDTKKEFFTGLKSAAESGWDFSSRWTMQNSIPTKSIKDTSLCNIAPLDLNSLMAYNAKTLSFLNKLLGNETSSQYYAILAYNFNKTISRLFWDDDEGMWFDYDIAANARYRSFYASNFVPLWADTFGIERKKSYIIKRVIQYIDRNSLDEYIGGLPTSLSQSGEQWDFPDGWAPLQYFYIIGLQQNEYLDERVAQFAFSMADKWVKNNYYAFINNIPHTMYEKYLANKIGETGKGGEYIPQIGFGWSNGVVFRLLNLYGHKLKINTSSDPIPTVFLVLLVTIAGVTVGAYLYRMEYFSCLYKKYHLLKHNW